MSVQRQYEIAFVVRVEANEDAMRESIQQVNNWVEKDFGGKVVKSDHWGRRRLAYEIDGQREGYYVILYAAMESKELFEFERNMRLSQSILRYLIVRPD